MRTSVFMLTLAVVAAGPALAQEPKASESLVTPASPTPATGTASTKPAASPGATAERRAPVDLEAARRRFDQDAAKHAAVEKSWDARIGKSMASICVGCGGDARPSKAQKAVERAR